MGKVFLELCPDCRAKGIECDFVNEVNTLIKKAKTQEQKDALAGKINEIRERYRWAPHFCRHTNYVFEYQTRKE